MKKILSVDWDYFQRVSLELLHECYPDGLDMPTFISEITWGNHYATDGDRLNNEVTLLQDEFRTITKIIMSQRKVIPVMATNSHVHAYDFITEYLQLGEEASLINIDMHHDIYNMNKNLDCGNWIQKLTNEGRLKKSSIGWIRNPVSFSMFGVTNKSNDSLSKLLRKIDKGKTVKAIEGEQFDLIYLARSDSWSAPHLDKQFCLLLNLMMSHFDNVRYEKGIDVPRTAYLQNAAEMRKVYEKCNRRKGDAV